MTHVTPTPVLYQQMNVPIPGTMIDNNPCRLSGYLPKIRRTAIIQLVAGGLLTCFGIVAIILLARWSYYATAIWSGLLIYVFTGCLGLRAASTGGKGMIRAYLGMSIIGCIMGLALTEMHVWAAILEGESRYGNWNWECQPGGYYSWIPNCAKSEAARVTFDALIVATGFFMFIHGIVSACFGCCASCACCRHCCDACCGTGGCANCCMPPPPPTTAMFPSYRTVMSGNLYQQGGAPVQNYPGMFIVQQAPPAAYPPPGMTYPGQHAPLQPGQQVYVVPSAGVTQYSPPYFYGAAPAQNPSAQPPQQQVDEEKVA